MERAKDKEINNRNNGTNNEPKEIGTAIEEFILKTKQSLCKEINDKFRSC